MPNTYGRFTLPAPGKTSDLVNDKRFMSIRDYVLNSDSLSGSSSISITDLVVGSVVQQVDLLVTTPFTPSGTQYNITVKGSDNTILMDPSWNDPNTAGMYSTPCYYRIVNSIIVEHDLGSLTGGSAVLRLHVYEAE